MIGYDMAIISPLLALPLFIEKYQGPPEQLTVRCLLLQLSQRELTG
jgi:hypothetical protein